MEKNIILVILRLSVDCRAFFVAILNAFLLKIWRTLPLIQNYNLEKN